MGNPISNDLQEETDNFLQDIAQMIGPINYTDIMYATQRLTLDEIRYLDKVAEQIYSGEETDTLEYAEKYFNFDENGEYKSIRNKKLLKIITKLHSTESDLEKLTEELNKLGIYLSENSGKITIILPNKQNYKLSPIFHNLGTYDEEDNPDFFLKCEREVV